MLEGVEDLFRSSCTCWKSMVDYYQFVLMLDKFILDDKNHPLIGPARLYTIIGSCN